MRIPSDNLFLITCNIIWLAKSWSKCHSKWIYFLIWNVLICWSLPLSENRRDNKCVALRYADNALKTPETAFWLLVRMAIRSCSYRKLFRTGAKPGSFVCCSCWFSCRWFILHWLLSDTVGTDLWSFNESDSLTSLKLYCTLNILAVSMCCIKWSDWNKYSNTAVIFSIAADSTNWRNIVPHSHISPSLVSHTVYLGNYQQYVELCVACAMSMLLNTVSINVQRNLAKTSLCESLYVTVA